MLKIFFIIVVVSSLISSVPLEADTLNPETTLFHFINLNSNLKNSGHDARQTELIESAQRNA